MEDLIPTLVDITNASNPRVVIVLPGVLATGSEQVAPVRDILGEVGDIIAYRYHPTTFRGDGVVQATAAALEDLLGRYQEVVVFGVSLGGIIAALAVVVC